MIRVSQLYFKWFLANSCFVLLFWFLITNGILPVEVAQLINRFTYCSMLLARYDTLLARYGSFPEWYGSFLSRCGTLLALYCSLLARYGSFYELWFGSFFNVMVRFLHGTVRYVFEVQQHGLGSEALVNLSLNFINSREMLLI